jgi:hypothetical protein
MFTAASWIQETLLFSENDDKQIWYIIHNSTDSLACKLVEWTLIISQGFLKYLDIIFYIWKSNEPLRLEVKMDRTDLYDGGGV